MNRNKALPIVIVEEVYILFAYFMERPYISRRKCHSRSYVAMRKLRTSHELPSWPPRGHQGEIAAAWAVPNGSMHLGGAPNLKAKLTRSCGRTFWWVGVSAKIRMGMSFFTAEEFSKFRQNKSQQRGTLKIHYIKLKRRSI